MRTLDAALKTAYGQGVRIATIGEASSTPAIRRIELPRWAQPALAGALLALLVLAISTAPEPAGSAMPGAATAGLEALPLAARPLVSTTLGRDRASYRIQRSGSALTATNRPHGLSARFGAHGVQVRTGGDTLALRLRAAGYGRTLHPVAPAAPAAGANRVSYRRGPLTEWYANGTFGLEQGFTLRSHPTGVRSGPLTLALSLSGSLRPALEHGHRSLRFAGSSLRYTGLAVFDATRRKLPARLDLHGRTLLIRVEDARASYPLTIDPFVQQVKLKPSDNTSVESVAISGDTIVALGGGAVHVFVKPAGGWAGATETAKLTAADGNSFDAVAISGDTIVAGSGNATISGHQFQGAVYVFTKPPGSWVNATQTAKLTASDGAGSDFLGSSVAIAGDTIVAGAPYSGYVDGDQGPGAAYVFLKPVGGWVSGTQTAKLTPSDGDQGEDTSSTGRNFGATVAISGTTVAIGAPNKYVGDYPGYFHGAVYVFVKPAGGWADGTETAELSAGSGTYLYISRSLAMSGDTIVAGAIGSSTYRGTAYVFVKPPTGWTDGAPSVALTPSDGVAYTYFGWSVAIAGNTIVAGAPRTIGDAHQGSAYVFSRPTVSGSWTEQQKLTDPDGVAGDRFGVSVAVGDTIVVGPGSARVFAQAPSAIAVTKQLLPASDPGRFDLKVAGTLVKAGAGDGGSGVIGLAPGTYRVSESAAPATNLSDYATSIACTMNGNPGPAADGTTHLDVTVATGDNVACTITNRRKATVTLTKHLLPSAASGRFDLKLTSSSGVRVAKTGAGDGDSGTIQVAPGTWTVLEGPAPGTSLSDYVSSIACTQNGTPGPSGSGTSLPVQLAPAAVLACTFTNRQTATITLTKSLVPASDPGRFDLRVGQSVVKAAAGDGGSGSIQVLPGTYRLTESAVSGTSLSNYATSIACTLNGNPGPSANGTTQLTVTLAANDNLVCTLTNRRKATITVTKHLVPSSDPGRFDLKVGGIVVKAGAADGGSGSRLVGAGTYAVSEAAAVGTSLANYTSSIACTKNGGSGPSGNGTSLNVGAAWGDVLVCTLINQRK